MPEEQKPAEQTPPEPPPIRAIEDDILSALGDDIVQMVDAARKKDAPPQAPEIKAAPETPQAPTPDPTPAAEPPKKSAKVGVRKRETAEDIANVVVNKLAMKRDETTTPLPPENKPPVSDYDESQLSPDQKEELEDAKFSEQRGKKGRAEELLKFYKSVDEYVAKAKQENPDRSFDENDEEFVQFIKSNRPAWADKEKEQIRRERFKFEAREEAKREVRKELEPEIKSAQQEAREAKYTPVIERRLDAFRSEIQAMAKSDDPMEKEIYEQFQVAAEEIAEDYLRLLNRVDTFGEHNPPDRRQRHEWIVNFINQQAAIFDERGGDNRVRDGKQFVTPTRFAEMQQQKQSTGSVWTFNQDDCLKMIQTHAVSVAKTQIQQEEETAKRRGFVKARPSGAAKSQTEPQPMGGPKASATPAPGAAQADATQDFEHPGKELIDVLDLRK